jgi:hypothetical protein
MLREVTQRSARWRYGAAMTVAPSSLLRTCVLTVACAVLLGAAAAPALVVRATPKHITAAGVGAVKLGRTHASLHGAGLVGRIRSGCELAGPRARGADLRAPLKGFVDYTQTAPRKVIDIYVRGGATARGVGIGATQPEVKAAFPKMIVDHGTESVFGITLLRIPKSDGGRMQFALDLKSKKVTAIGIPYLPFCE